MAGFLAPTLWIVFFLATNYASQFKYDASPKCSIFGLILPPTPIGGLHTKALRKKRKKRRKCP
jgi:hypothetical protein